jgi:hypothetical protein
VGEREIWGEVGWVGADLYLPPIPFSLTRECRADEAEGGDEAIIAVCVCACVCVCVCVRVCV